MIRVSVTTFDAGAHLGQQWPSSVPLETLYSLLPGFEAIPSIARVEGAIVRRDGTRRTWRVWERDASGGLQCLR